MPDTITRERLAFESYQMCHGEGYLIPSTEHLKALAGYIASNPEAKRRFLEDAAKGRAAYLSEPSVFDTLQQLINTPVRG